MQNSFYIDDTEFFWEYASDNKLKIKSAIGDYKVILSESTDPKEMILKYTEAGKHSVIIVDSYIYKKYEFNHINVPILTIHAKESNKNINTVLAIIDFLRENQVTKGSETFVIGGGILQDVSAFSLSTYRRGVPWTYIPTTLLAQADSCIGAKSCLNYHNIKNLLGLFYSPNNIILNLIFLNSLDKKEIKSGLGEIFRLHITGGLSSFKEYKADMQKYEEGDTTKLRTLILRALSIKKEIIEKDEFDSHERRAMNFGHSVGHAIETLSEYTIPHGTAIVLGTIIEGYISLQNGTTNKKDFEEIETWGSKLLTKETLSILSKLDLGKTLKVMREDKKTKGNEIKLTVFESFGRLSFVNKDLSYPLQCEINDAVNHILQLNR